MGSRGKPPGEQRAAPGVQWSDDGEDPGETGPAADLEALLAELDDAGEVQITREEPTWAAGFIGTWPVHDLDALSLLERMQRELGGHVYRLQPLRRGPSGKKTFARGSRRVRIAGPPLFDGQPWPGHSQGQRPAYIDTTASVAASRAPAPPRELAALFQPLAGIAEMLGELKAAINRPPPAPAPVAGLGGLEGALASLRGLKELKALARELLEEDDDDDEDDDEPAEAAAPAKPPSMEDMLMQFLASKVGGEAPAPSSSAPSSSAPSSSAPPMRPRLIRKGEGEGEGEAEGEAEADAAPATPTDAAQVVAQKMAQLTPDQAVAFFGEVFSRLPAEVQAKLAAASMGQIERAMSR